MPELHETDPSDSAVQREIESTMLDRLGEQHPGWRRVVWKVISTDLGLPAPWRNAKPDAVWKTEQDQLIVAESYSRIGELNAGHRRKIATDALKLLALKHTFAGNGHVRYLIVVPEELSKRLSKLEGWLPAALSVAAEIVSVALLPGERKRLLEASARQAQGQARVKNASKAPRE